MKRSLNQKSILICLLFRLFTESTCMLSSVRPFFLQPDNEDIIQTSLEYLHPETLEKREISCKARYHTNPIKAQDSQNPVGVSNLVQKPADEVLERISGLCITQTFDYWSYKICFEQSIVQFRGDNTFDLGSYSETLSTDEAEYVGEVFSHGTRCESSGELKERSSVVEFYCGSKLEILMMEEVETCEYLFHVSAPIVCGYEGFRQIIPESMQGTELGRELDPSERWNLELVVFEDFISGKKQAQCSAKKLASRGLPKEMEKDYGRKYPKALDDKFTFRSWNFEFDEEVREKLKLDLKSFSLEIDVEEGEKVELLPLHHNFIKNDESQVSKENGEFVLSTDGDANGLAKGLSIETKDGFEGDVSFIKILTIVHEA
eukprot:snap_masked-scaffold_34-processed-gene-3.23-mRNA-1 protein AED:1.00 eAED:1.00 QI:0/-1/0/0/-1/1/1/0/374